VLLLDEPFAAVDAALRSVLVADVSEVLRSLGLTALHVTHDEDEPRALGAVQTIRLGAA
jgi:putative spermidine/putrescine transport system ATP-binding protein